MTTLFTGQDVEKQKSMGNCRLAGQMARLLGLPMTYGAHYGMRSTRHQSVAEFYTGWWEVEDALSIGPDAGACIDHAPTPAQEAALDANQKLFDEAQEAFLKGEGMK